MNSDPQKRPRAYEIDSTIYYWLYDIARSNDKEIKKQFLDADKVIKILPINSPSHLDHIYTSKLISTKLISNTIKEGNLFFKFIY